jgi:hypothetical protein
MLAKKLELCLLFLDAAAPALREQSKASQQDMQAFSM